MGVSEVWIAASTDWVNIGKVKDVGEGRCLEIRQPTGETTGTTAKGGIDESWDAWKRVWSANGHGGGRRPLKGGGIL